MNNEMININANLVDEIKISTFTRDDKEVTVANFTLVKKYGDGKEYINCSAYADKVEVAKHSQKVIVSMYMDITKKIEKKIRCIRTLS